MEWFLSGLTYLDRHEKEKRRTFEILQRDTSRDEMAVLVLFWKDVSNRRQESQVTGGASASRMSVAMSADDNAAAQKLNRTMKRGNSSIFGSVKKSGF